ncbi:MAG TPA: F0F1 ATP synthase subunit B [Puia sp.]|nr:F0F1 ATP synthase subunit B [Puia sp.]
MKLLLPEFGLLIWTLIAFLLVYFILRKFAWPAIVKGLAEREKSISDSLATAEKVRAEMAQLKSENEQLLAKAREEGAQLLKQARETRDKIISEAKEQAKLDAAKIMADAELAIEQKKMAVLTDVKNQVGNLIIDVAETILRKELSDKAEQEKYILKLTNEYKLN